MIPWDRSALVGLVGGLNGAIFRRLTWRGRRLSVGSGVGSGLRGVGSGLGTGDGMYTARCGGPPSRVRAMRFPDASTAGMVPEELCRSKRRRRPACVLGPSLARTPGRQVYDPSTGLSAPAGAGGAALPVRTPERLPRRLARPELDNAVFSSVLQPLAN